MLAGIYTNIYKDADLSVTKALSERLVKSGFGVLLYGEAAAAAKVIDGFESIERPDVMLTLGGDGTILRIAEFCAERGIPILGLNLGTVGFLTGLEKADLDKLSDILKKRAYTTEKRAMLKIKFSGQEILALNEVVLTRASGGKMITLDIAVNGEFVDRYFCDGFIVSTPTGSTAYSLSAGGPIISPLADVIALTPVSPHTLHARPVVTAGADTVSIVFTGEAECAVVADGREAGAITAGGLVEIVKSEKNAIFLKTGIESFFSRLLHKLNTWGVTERK